jgi:YcxB-like protein
MRALPFFGLFQFAGGVWYLGNDPKQNKGALMLIAIGLFLMSHSWLRARQTFKKGRLGEETQVEISDSGVDASNSVANTKFVWGAFSRYTESKNLFLVYQSQLMFNIFPKRAFAAGDMDAFQGLLEQHLGNASKAYRKKVKLKTWIWAAVFVIVTVLLVIKIAMIHRTDDGAGEGPAAQQVLRRAQDGDLAIRMA